MKIAIILPSLANKGPIICARDIINYILDNEPGHQVDVYYLDEGPSIDFPCPTYKISFLKGFDFSKYDILHSHMLRPDAFLFFHKWKIRGYRVTTLHVYMYLDLMYTYNKMTAYLAQKIWSLFIKNFDQIVTLSKDMTSYYNKIIPESKFKIINNGRNIKDSEIDRSIIENISKKFNGKIIIGIIALLTKRKGIEQMIHCLNLNDTFALLVIGDGPEKENLEHLARDLGVIERVIFLGLQKDAHIYNKIIDIFLLPSRSEGLPMSLIEAAYYKKPCVCSNLELFSEFFTDDEIITFQLDNIVSLNKALLNAWEKRIYLSDNIFEKYLKNYQSKIMGANYFALYTGLMNETN